MPPLLTSKTLLVIAPHPDDETLACGGLIASAARKGTKVRVLIVTDGAGAAVAGHTDPKVVASLRQEETIRAAAELGLQADDLVFLDLPDEHVEEHLAALTAALSNHIDGLAPELILCPYEDDAHPDHRAAAKALRLLAAQKPMACSILFYPMWFWPKRALSYAFRSLMKKELRSLDVSAALPAKKAAIAAYRSQFEDQPTPEHKALFHELFLTLALQKEELFFEWET